MSIAERLARSLGFDWDEGNLPKLLARHKVSASEFEQIFFNEPLVAESDVKHSDREERFYALGHTDAGRLLFVIFTIRTDLIRTVSARDMKRKERREYEKL